MVAVIHAIHFLLRNVGLGCLAYFLSKFSSVQSLIQPMCHDEFLNSQTRACLDARKSGSIAGCCLMIWILSEYVDAKSRM